MADRRIAKQLPVRYFEDVREAEPLIIDRVLIKSNREVSSVDSADIAFSSNDFWPASQFPISQTYTPDDITNDPEVSASGHVYFWNSGTLIENVTITYDLAGDGTSSSVQTDAEGRFETGSLGADGATITAGLDVTASDTSRIITAADAFATLKISVGLNPNSDPDGSGPLEADPISPYQLVAADVNGDGRVTSADAFAILKMAVGSSTAIQSQWLFVPEASGYWSPDNGVGTDGGMTVRNVTWDDQGITVDSPSFQTNFVAVLLGDVNGSWSSSRGDLPTLPDTYFEQLQDPAPNFIDPTPTLVIAESQVQNLALFYSNAIDEGNNAGTLTYALTEDANGLFAIDDANGAISLIGSLDYESATDYTLVVTVTDQGGKTAEQTISVVVTNVDDYPPSITSGDTATAIDENSGADQIIYTATSDDSADISGGVTYSLAEGSDTALSIDAQTGAVTLSADPDFETQASYTFTVIATDAAGNSSEQAVSLAINNLDEVAPSITSGDTATAIDENSGADQIIYTATSDDSADISGGVTYSLAEGSDTALSIDAQTGAVTLSADPDFETQASYSFTVIATDAAGNSSEQAVLLAINNADEVAPSITSGDTATAIDENSGADQIIYTATSDDSADISGGVTYSLAAGSDTALSIDAQTGAVTLSSDPDFETQASYTFTVIATDAAGNSIEQAVSLAINNLDEVAPSITSGDTATALDENSGAEQIIYTATSDDSADISGGLTYSLAEGSDTAVSIDAQSGAVTLSADPDFETQASYSFTVIATDAAGNSSEQAVSLAINNLDEVAPSITSGDTATAIDENSGAEQIIYTATSDDSADISGGVTYSLAEGSDTALSIDAQTGAVTLSADPDFETQASYTFTVIATDAAGNSSEQAVSLAINNLDEVAPSITSGDTATAIDENSGADQIIYTATSDDSADISGGVTYSLAAGSDTALSIDAQTGAVTLSSDPDFETQASYTFTVIATDAAGNSIEQAVSLAINNLDEVAPSITSGDTATALDENSGTEQIIYTATSDDSADISGGVTYSLAEGSDTALSIDAQTGAVTLSSDPDFETQASYTFTVIATDAAGNSSEQAVLLAINNLDEVAPSITSSATATAIDENSGADQIIYTATSDDSADISGGLTYSLAEGSDTALSIDAQTGAVTLSADPDFETQASYSFTVIATDAAGNSSEQAVSLAINNLDEVAPSITSSATATAIDENSGADQIIYTATSDDSADISGGVTYSLAEGSDTALSIDAQTGAVTLSSDPDFETQASYSFTVIATDAAGNSSEQAVSLAINNQDEVAPSITSSATAAAIDENSGAEQIIYTATSDDSADISGGLTYSLAEGSDTALSIDAQTGAVTLSADPDFETQASYSFTVIATDAAGNSSEQAVSLAINNLDEVAPSITSSATATAIDENSGADQIIYTATSDDSADISGGVTYSLAEGSDTALSIDAQTGAVTLSSDLDFETQASYTFTVIATDAAGNSSEQAVSLAINNLDEVAPSITSAATATAIDENSGADQIIYTATSDDSADTSGGVTYSLVQNTADLSVETVSAGVIDVSVAPNSDGTYTLTFMIGSNLPATLSGSIQNFDFVLTADIDDFAPITSLALTSSLEIGLAGSHPDGSITLGAISANTSVEISPGAVLGSLVVQPLHDGTITIGLSDISLGDAVIEPAGEPVYNFVLPTPDFSIDPESGDVTLLESPNFEIQSSYEFTVLAVDNAGNTREQVVTLGVNNLDESAPEIVSPVADQTVDENVGIGAVLYTIVADDSLDASEGLSYAIEGASTELSHQIVGDAPIVITVESNADGSLTLIFTWGDTSSLGLSGAIQNFDMVISLDSGSLAPISSADFSSGFGIAIAGTQEDGSLSLGAISANPVSAGAGDELGRLVIRPLDTNGVQLTIQEFIAGADVDVLGGVPGPTHSIIPPQLAVDSNTGVVTLLTNPDYEVQSSYEFTAVVTDVAGYQTRADVVVSVNNLDESAPVITSPGIVSALDENNPAGVVVYRATADDSGDVSGGVTYALSDDSDTALSINATTGEVTLNESADYETQSAYSFVIVATDLAGNQSYKTLTLHVNNLDEVAPIFTSSAQTDVLSENNTPGVHVYTATSTDIGDVSDGVNYSIIDDAAGLFGIDSGSGQIYFYGVADFEGQNTYEFTVAATDGAGNQSAQTVTLEIGNVDEVAPTITSSDTGMSVQENSAPNQVVYMATATDDQDVSDGVLFFVSGEHADRFSMNETSGELTLLESPDFEVIPNYLVEVIAVDLAGNQSSKFVTIAIEDIDDTGPIFSSSSDPVVVVENTGPDQVVYTAVASDPAGVTYSLAPSADTQVQFTPVVVSLQTGGFDLSVQDNQDGSYVLEFYASSAAAASVGNVLNNFDAVLEFDASQFMPITAADVATTLEYSVANTETDGRIVMAAFGSVPQDLTAGQPVFAVTVTPLTAELVVINATETIFGTEQQGATSNSLQFSVPSLSIDPNTGEVTLLPSPDFESRDTYEFTIVAEDGLGNKTELPLVLNVQNVIEEPLAFLSPDTGAAFTQTPFVYQARASSADASGDQSVTYSLAAEGDYHLLQIDSQTGMVSLRAGLVGPDLYSNFSFTVVADDGVNDPISQSVSLSVPAANVVQNSRVLQQGGIQIVDTDNGDGTYTLDFYINPDIAGQFPGIGSFDFVIEFNSSDFEPISGSDFTHNSLFTVVLNDTIDGQLSLGSFLGNPFGDYYDPASGDPLTSLIVTPVTGGDITISITGVLVENDDAQLADLDDTMVVYGEPSMVSGTVTPESFVLASGGAMIDAGPGPDIFVVTSQVGSQISISDFSQEDLIDFSYALMEAGYHSSTPDVSIPILNQARLLTAVSQDDLSGSASQVPLDNGFGIFPDTLTGEIWGFYDVNPALNRVDLITFQINVGDSASDISTDNIIAQVTTGVPITSGDIATSVTENNAAPVVIYIAHADLSSGRSVEFDLAPGDEQFFSIDPLTGEISFIGFADYETKSEYTFTVIATDNFGETSSQVVLMPVLNQDEVAPVWRSKTEVSTLIGSAVLYTASADDSGDISVEPISYSLDPNSVDFSYLSIDAASGEVVFKPGVVLPEGKVDYVFTAIADDGVNPSIAQQVVVTLTDTITVTGSGVLSQGGIRVVDVDNGDGSWTLEFYLDASVTQNLAGVGSFDFVVNYDSAQFEQISGADFMHNSLFTVLVNDTVSDQFSIGAFLGNPFGDYYDPSSGEPLTSLIVVPVTPGNISLSVSNVIIENDDATLTRYPDTVIIYSDGIAIYQGTEYRETFILESGQASVSGGIGADVFVVTPTTGTQIDISDFAADDVIDFSSVLLQSGYKYITETVIASAADNQAYVRSDLSIVDLVGILANQSQYDNTVGAFVDSGNGEVFGFYDSDPTAGNVDVNSFRLGIGDAANGITMLNVEAVLNVGPAFTSGAVGGSVIENDPTDQLVYTAAVEVEAGQSVTFGLAAGVEEFFTIDAQTGQVTFIGTADYETASTLGFTVVATDNEGNASRQSVSIPVVNVDDTAPTWVSPTSFTALANTPFVYAAEATDDADVSLEPVQYSLDPNSADADLLFIDSEMGIVTLQQGVLVPEGKQAFTFTVVATDGVNDPVSQQVVASIGATTAVQGTGVLAQGGIQVVDVDNGDGSYTLDFYVDSTVASLFPDGVENYDFVFNYNADQFQPIAASDYATSFSLPTVNYEVAGKLVVVAVDLTALDLADGTPLGSLTVTPLVENGIEVSVTDVIVNTSDLSPTQIIYGEPAIVSGTADNDTFTLLGGDTEITGGLGVDAFIVTETTGSQIYITDFMPGEDVIDMSSLLMGLGYTSLSDVFLAPATNGEARETTLTSMDLLELMLADDLMFDNSFGMLIDDANGKIIGFYDADSNADSVDMRTFEINIGDAVKDITLEDLTAGIGGFIA